MGIYVNPNNVNFLDALNSLIYVDKSMLIAEINRLVRTTKRFVCVSRSRRFGKTMAGNMLNAYFSKGCDSRELFKDLKIAKDPSFEKYLNKFNVIKLDLNAVLSNRTPKEIEGGGGSEEKRCCSNIHESGCSRIAVDISKFEY